MSKQFLVGKKLACGHQTNTLPVKPTFNCLNKCTCTHINKKVNKENIINVLA